MNISGIHSVSPFRIYDAGKRPSVMLDHPVPKVNDVLSLKEQMQQAEVDANLWCAYMKHQRRILEIILDGMSYTYICFCLTISRLSNR